MNIPTYETQQRTNYFSNHLINIIPLGFIRRANLFHPCCEGDFNDSACNELEMGLWLFELGSKYCEGNATMNNFDQEMKLKSL
jgi:hypothetical protein